jgi:hypothetical protein
MFAKYPKIANPTDFFFGNNRFLNKIRKQIIHTKINTMKTNFFTIITIVTTFMFSSSVFAQVDGPILNGVDNSEYKTIELINMDKDLSTLQTC